jgi:uncharacterized protein
MKKFVFTLLTAAAMACIQGAGETKVGHIYLLGEGAADELPPQAGVAQWAVCERLGAPGGVPSFDCLKASGQVEKLICSDPELAGLDTELACLYRAVSAKAAGQELEKLRAYQRGWIKGRNECWKAIGASVRECVEASYRGRIKELRSQF